MGRVPDTVQHQWEPSQRVGGCGWDEGSGCVRVSAAGAGSVAVTAPALLTQTGVGRSWQLLAAAFSCLISGDRDVQARWTLGNSGPL